MKDILKSIAAIIIAAMLFSCENDMDAIAAISIEKNMPVDIAHDIQMVYSDSGQVKMLLVSPVMKKFETEQPYTEMDEGIKVYFYNDSNEVSSYMTADYAIMHPKTKILEAKKNVVIVGSDGRKLNTEYLVWDQNKRIIYSNERVQITEADRIVWYESFESDENFENWVGHGIKAEVFLDE